MAYLKKRVGKRLAELRLAKKMTQAQVAEAVGVEPASANRWEAGMYLPDADRIEALSDLFGVDPAYFFTSDDKVIPKVEPGVPRDLLESILIADEVEMRTFMTVLNSIRERQSGRIPLRKRKA